MGKKKEEKIWRWWWYSDATTTMAGCDLNIMVEVGGRTKRKWERRRTKNRM